MVLDSEKTNSGEENMILEGIQFQNSRVCRKL